MQKIVIKNFGAIKEAEIDIPKTLVLIGEQASGKSTIAKLIYFFQELRDDYFNELVNSEGKVDFHFLVKSKFYDFFGTVEQILNFEIIFYWNFDNESLIKITKTQIKDLTIDINLYKRKSNEHLIIPAIIDSLRLGIEEINEQLINATDIQEIALLKSSLRKNTDDLRNRLNSIFSKHFENDLFIIAGRNATVQYNDLFEKYLFAEVKNRIEENKNQQQLELKEQTIDEYLTMQFMERVSRLKTIFERNGGTFHSLLKSENKNGIFQKAENKISEILKGKYSSDKSGEKIHLENGSFVRLSNASSGQQESIRILQDLFLVILQNQKVLRIVEEPEAHLFPIAQKQMIELLALMVNQNVENTLIVTTHSPYILSTFNNLLFASRVVEKNPDAENDVSEVVDIDFRLKASDFAAYTLRFTEGGFVSESIMSDRGVIKQNYLDTVSEMLGSEFNQLYSIHAKTFARK